MPPIDPRIPLGADIGPQVDPFKAFDYALRMRQAKRLEQQDAIEAQYRQQALMERQQEIAEKAREREEKQRATQEFNATMQRVFESGEPSSQAVQQELVKAGRADLFLKIEPHLRGFDEARKKTQEAKLDAAKNIAATIHEFGNTPEALEQARPFFRAAGWSDDELAPYLQAAQQDPASIAFMTRTLAGDKIKPKAAETGRTREIKTVDDQGNPVIQIVPDVPGQTFAERPAALQERNPTEASLALAAAGGDPARAFRMLSAPKPGEERLVQVMGPEGTPIWVRESQAVGKPSAQAARAPTGSERQTLAFYNRAQNSVDNIKDIEPQIARSSIVQQGRLKYAPDVALSQNQKLYRQAQRAFTEARLRKESGAAIPEHEYDNDARTYFAQPGDNPATIQQKREAREVVLNGLKFASGRAYEEYYGEPAPKAGAPKVETVERGPDGKLKLVK